MKYYDRLIFELSKEGRTGYSLPRNPWKQSTNDIPAELQRTTDTGLPQVDELGVVRHYTNLSNMNFGVDTGFYPLGSCTMKYNPKINEEMAGLNGFKNLHPLQPTETAQGALELYYELNRSLATITGMAECTLNPFAGAHGELTGLMIMRQYHLLRGDLKRTKVIVPDSAHGTNPASAAVCGLDVVEVKSRPDGTIDIESLRSVLDDTIAGIMMTNPNTLGLFETRILEIAKMVHECGGLLYYDGANMNPLLGRCRPGDMGFDILHLNLHKTFSTPHGGGGPGAGAVGVAAHLTEYLPNPRVIRTADGRYEAVTGKDAIGQVSGFLGNYSVLQRAYTYILALGKEYIRYAGPLATLNANYIKEELKGDYKLPIDTLCKHEFVFDGLADTSTGVTTLDIAKRLLDYGYHAPTIYFPLLFHQSIMIEPTETESLETIDSFIAIMKKIAEEARTMPDELKTAPHNTPVRRLDETTAAKTPILTYTELKNQAG